MSSCNIPRAAALSLSLAAALAGPPADAAVTLKIYDRDGKALDATAARKLMRGAGGPDRDYSDALVDPVTLQDRAEAPLYDERRQLVFDAPAQPAALALQWPTTQGYSLLIVDNGGAGFSGDADRTLNLTYQAALDVKRRLDAAVAARPDYVLSNAFLGAYGRADAHLKTARDSSVDAVRGQYGQRALDELVAAQNTMLAEYGVAYARRNLTVRPPVIGVTLDRIDAYIADLDRAQRIGGAHTWVRIVFDSGRPLADYRPVVRAAKERGLRILGEPIDSYEVAERYGSVASYVARMKQAIDAFPEIDAWEAGNEVNGRWLEDENASTPPTMPQKIAQTVAYLDAKRPRPQVMLTLYWQIGTDAPEWSTFNWARANLPASVRSKIDVIGLSTYVEDAPLGVAMDQVFQALHAEFPAQRIVFGELDYWLAGDTAQTWWAFDPLDIRKARSALASHYYAAALGYGYSLGGGYWWNFSGHRADGDPSLDAIEAVVRAATTPARRGNE